ncbi:MAG: dihydrofolate reductase family protein, partial [Trebonia sp.]
MRLLYGGTGEIGSDLTDDQVADAYPWPASGPWVRAMMITTLDGAAAGPDGLSGSLSSTADQAVFNAVRRHADAVLIGAGTLRAERYTPMRAKPADARRRAMDGQRAAPTVVVVSGSLALPWSLPLWTQSTHRPLVLTSTATDPRRLEEARTRAEVIAVPQLTPQAIIDAMIERRLTRIVCEGGPRLLHELV